MENQLLKYATKGPMSAVTVKYMARDVVRISVGGCMPINHKRISSLVAGTKLELPVQELVDAKMGECNYYTYDDLNGDSYTILTYKAFDGSDGSMSVYIPEWQEALRFDRKQVIVSSAMRSPSGIIIACVRHGDELFYNAVDNMKLCDEDKDFNYWEQGFVDQYREFLTREEAWVIAEENGQIKHKLGCDDAKRLYSENLYQ